MTPGTLALRPAAWLASPGPADGIVLASRVRLARNIAGRPFFRTMAKPRQQELVDELLAVLAQAGGWPEAHGWCLGRLPEVERQMLVERQLISREHAKAKRPGGLYLSPDETVAVMVNEEDHLRLQVILPGLALPTALAAAVDLDRRIEALVPYAVDPQLGYLTTCHTNLGTGMRASVMLHLPALAESDGLKPILRGLAKLHLTVRGRHGEGSDAGGNHYQISNLRSLGCDENGLVCAVTAAVERVVEAERLARERLLTHARPRLEDKVWRAWGLLTHARVLTGDEVGEHLGWLRLGLALGVLPSAAEGLQWAVLDRLAGITQPAHLQLCLPGLDEPAARDATRAQLVRDALLGR
jgi:protein arginine kinase